jgi:GNAT superfamily N-acetyltransferase
MDGSLRLGIEYDSAPTSAAIAQVRAGLMAYNESAVGVADVRQLAWYLRDATGTLRGGLVGYLAWRWLMIDLLWVDEAVRGHGYGRALLEQAETVAREAGCVAARLDTYEFQARPFYEHHGYAVFGVLEGYPANTRTYYMKKALEPAPQRGT